MRSGLELRSAALMRSMLQHTDSSVCLTDLDRYFLAANSHFGDMFGVDIEAIVSAREQNFVRESLAPRFVDFDAWKAGADRMYADHSATGREEVHLNAPRQILKSFSAPVLDESGRPVARLWKFDDVTEERRLAQMRDRLYDVSIFNDPVPLRVLSYIAEAIGQTYGATCLVSIMRGDFVDYRAVGGPPGPMANLLGATLDQAYCRLPIEGMEPVIITRTGQDPRTRGLLPTRLGFRSYVGVPVFAAGGSVLGAISLLTDRDDLDFDEEDSRFLSLMAMRVASELDRERYMGEQISLHQTVVESQASDLQSTRDVLEAINHAFELVTFDEPIESVLVAQAALLENLLGFGANAIVRSGTGGEGTLLATPFGHRIVQAPESLSNLRGLTWLRRDVVRLLGLEEFGEVLAVPLGGERQRFGALLYGSNARFEVDAHRQVHLEAIAEQISLTLEAYALRSELLKANDDLEKAQAAFVQSERLASIGTLSAVVAHDIKNIMAAVAIELSSPDEPVRTLSSVRLHLDRFAVLSHRLLSYAKPRMVVKNRVNVDDLLKRITKLTSEQMRISDIQFVQTSAPGGLIVLGDVNQLEHMIVNILVNSIQAMSAARGGLIEIKTKRTGRRATIEIRDTGPGIAPENLPRVFDPFFSTRHEGLGLGLHAARRIATEHGGEIKVSSTLGVGTTITVVLQTPPTDQ